MRQRSESFFNKKEVASFAGLAVGFVTSSYSTGVISTTGVFATPILPIVVGSLLGLLPANVIHKHLAAKYDEIFRNSPNTNAFCHFTIRATTAVVGILLGLIVTSLMVNLAINPFVLPALVAGGISAAIIIGLYAYAYSVLRPAMRRTGLDGLAETIEQQIDDMPNSVTITIETDGSELDEDDLRGLISLTKYSGRGGRKQELDISLSNKDKVIEILKAKKGVICVESEITDYGREIAGTTVMNRV
ncbi:MAG: hypothetical protein KBB94_09285 [Legionellaceae bacterium]|nr:hypothetical protein [Legionellaceae bacterium]MBP9774587.1 hypothetical protein [Legionellaceae bacterium]